MPPEAGNSRCFVVKPMKSCFRGLLVKRYSHVTSIGQLDFAHACVFDGLCKGELYQMGIDSGAGLSNGAETRHGH